MLFPVPDQALPLEIKIALTGAFQRLRLHASKARCVLGWITGWGTGILFFSLSCMPRVWLKNKKWKNVRKTNCSHYLWLPWCSVGKESTWVRETWIWSVGQEEPLDKGTVPTPVFRLENSIVHEVTKSQTWLSNFHFHFLSPSDWMWKVCISFPDGSLLKTLSSSASVTQAPGFLPDSQCVLGHECCLLAQVLSFLIWHTFWKLYFSRCLSKGHP